MAKELDKERVDMEGGSTSKAEDIGRESPSFPSWTGLGSRLSQHTSWADERMVAASGFGSAAISLHDLPQSTGIPWDSTPSSVEWGRYFTQDTHPQGYVTGNW